VIIQLVTTLFERRGRLLELARGFCVGTRDSNWNQNLLREQGFLDLAVFLSLPCSSACRVGGPERTHGKIRGM
jgi:hypothetical protein